VPVRHGWIAAAAKLRPILRELKPDVVHSATFPANMAARLAVGRSGTPQLSWLVSMEYDPASVRLAGLSAWKNRVFGWVDAAAARYARSSFIACSEAVRRSAIEQLRIAPSNIGVIYNPVRIAALEPAPGEAAALRRELGLPDDAFVYLNIGRMDAPKAQGLILEAFATVAGEQPNGYVVILGRGSLAEQLLDQARALGIEQRVRFVSSASRIAPFLELAEVFVFPSLLEGLPVALLESMCAGIPAIASDIAPHAEVVRSGVTGFLVPAGSADAIAQQMRRLYGDAALRREIGAAAAEEARARFSTAAIVPQWEAAFLTAARRGRAG
jgi:glycosyltransferase involved in cell wall biosynthesis